MFLPLLHLFAFFFLTLFPQQVRGPKIEVEGTVKCRRCAQWSGAQQAIGEGSGPCMLDEAPHPQAELYLRQREPDGWDRTLSGHRHTPIDQDGNFKVHGTSDDDAPEYKIYLLLRHRCQGEASEPLRTDSDCHYYVEYTLANKDGLQKVQIMLGVEGQEGYLIRQECWDKKHPPGRKLLAAMEPKVESDGGGNGTRPGDNDVEFELFKGSGSGRQNSSNSNNKHGTNYTVVNGGDEAD